MLTLSTWRWRVLLRAQGYPAPLRDLSASYLVATFFNNFLPSNIGGDVIRVRDSSRITGSVVTSLAVVAVDRILGFGALYFIALVAYFNAPPDVRGLFGAREVFAALSYVFFRPGTARRVLGLTRLNRIPWVRQRFEVVQGAVHVYRSRKLAVALAFVSSVALQGLFVGYYYSIALALDIKLAPVACGLIVPLCTLVQAVPISFNGWGLRENVFLAYFRQLEVEHWAEAAPAFSLVGAGMIVLLSLSGAVVWTSRGVVDPVPSSSEPPLGEKP
jgi:uncharacterized protein (TIRG00374 family)